MRGMADGGKIWLTNVEYMNDSAEFHFFWNVLKKKVEEILGIKMEIKTYGIKSAIVAECNSILAIVEFGSYKSVIPVFSTSLSEDRDSLSQWRGYCPNGGYALSFYKEGSFKDSQLSQMISRHNLYIGKCKYGEPESETLIKSVFPGHEIRDFTDFMRNGAEATKYSGKGYPPYGIELKLKVEKIIKRLIPFASFIKHEKFSAEKEWRIVAYDDNHGYEKFLKFRDGRSFMVPYLEVPLRPDSTTTEKQEPVQIEEILIGPTPEPRLAKNAYELFKRDYDTTVTSSEIPYRNW